MLSLDHHPPMAPYLAAMPRVLDLLAGPIAETPQVIDFLCTHLGGVPHESVRPVWVTYLASLPLVELRGNPLCFRHNGAAPAGIQDAATIDGVHMGGVVRPGEAFTSRHWGLLLHPDFEEIDRAPWAPKIAEDTHKSWDEVKAMGFKSAKGYLETLGVHGRSWADLELEYAGYCLGES